MKEEGGPGAVELVWDVPLPERDQPTHVIHARDLDKKMYCGLGKTHIKTFFSGRTTKVLPSRHFFFFFGLKQPDFREKSVFLFSGQGAVPSLHP